MKQNLFLDAAEEIIKKNNYLLEEKKKKNISIKHFKVDDENTKIMKRSKGDYYTIFYDNNILLNKQKSLANEVVNILKTLFKNYKRRGRTLIVGLGNSSIPSDAIGPNTINKVIATNHFNDFLTIPKVCLFVPEVTSKTGISSYYLIKMVIESLKPDTIIVIDSLVTSNHYKLNNCIEISDTGIIPGSALRAGKEISSKTFGIPVIAIGIPLLININNNLYTSPNIMEVLEETSNILASSLNNLFLS